MTDTPRVTVLGAGSWGTALAKHLADQGMETTLWARRAEQAAAINRDHTNPSYLQGVPLPDTLRATADLEDALKGTELLVVVVPTGANRGLLECVVPVLGADVPVVSATKGIEQGTHKLVSQIFEDVFPEERHRNLTYLGGPSFAKEVVAGVPTGVVVAGHDERSASACSASSTRGSSASTRPPTSSGSRSAARSRTSSPSPRALRTAWASATTRARRSSPAASRS